MLIVKETLLIVLFTATMLLSSSREVGAETALRDESGVSDSLSGEYLAARYAARHGMSARAVAHYGTALSRESNDLGLLEKTTAAYLQMGEAEKAIQLADRHRKLDPKASLPQLLGNLRQMKKGEFEAVEASLLPLLQEPPIGEASAERLLLSLMMTWAEAGSRKYAAAQARLAGIEPDPALGRFLVYQRGLLYLHAGEHAKAGEQFDTLRDNPGTYRVARSLAEFYTRTGDASSSSTVLDAFRKHNPQFVLSDADILTAEPGVPSADEAVSRGMAGALQDIAGLLYGVGRSEEAMSYFHMAVYLDPAAEDARILLGSILTAETRYDEADALYAALPDTSPFYLRARIAMAQNESRRENADKAESMLRELSARFPAKYEALLSLGDLLLDRKRFADAVDVYSEALDRIGTPTREYWPVLYVRGICHERAGSWEKAEKDFHAALALDPDQPEVLNYLGYSWLMRNANLTQAEQMLRTAVMKRPRDAHIIDSYGWALYTLGRYAESLEYLEAATQMLPHDPTTNDHLGDVYWRTGRQTEARFQWNRALGFNPEPADADRIRVKLDRGLLPSPFHAAAFPSDAE